jgi:aryl-alcohol dehydrogenase-like predicted oxidoreductase
MMERRTLGKTNQALSVIGFGGIVVMDVSPIEASNLVSRAIDRGINYFDVAPTYGNAEERLGPALAPYRQNVFLACKTTQRLREGALLELETSLKRLKTDHFDLYQLHGVASVEEAEQIIGAGGALEAFLSARERGMIRHIGFSAHSEEAAMRLLESFSFDSMLFPVNQACWQKGAFGPRVVSEAQNRGTGILALKSLAKRRWREGEPRKWPKCWYVPVDTLEEARKALAFTLSKPVTAALCPGHAELLWLTCEALDSLHERPLQSAELDTTDAEPIFRASGTN